MENYRYCKEGDTILRCKCEKDPEPMSPIGEEYMLSTMLIWWNRYRLGNENDYSDHEDFLFSTLEDYPDDEIADYAKKRGITKPENGYDVLDGFSVRDAVGFLREHGCLIFPLYIYEHGGITISMGSFEKKPGYPFSDQFDAGFAGFIFIRKDEYLKKTGNKESGWKERAEKCMRNEVELYDMYLRGSIYGLIVQEMEEDGKWHDRESTWGYFSDSFGDDLVRELASEYIGDTYATIEEAAAA